MSPVFHLRRTRGRRPAEAPRVLEEGIVKGLRMFWNIVKKCHFDKFLIGFFVCFFAGAAVIQAVEPGIDRYGDALWYLFVASTTIGFGDIVVETFAGRMVSVIIVIYEIVLTACLSGVIVSNYLEVVHRREKYTATVMLDKLSHLTELNKDELAEIEDKVRTLEKNRP